MANEDKKPTSETTRTFGGHTAEEVADLCDTLARSADHMTNSYSETASIARRARDAIRYLLGEIRDWQDEVRALTEGFAHNAGLDRAEIEFWKERANEQ